MLPSCMCLLGLKPAVLVLNISWPKANGDSGHLGCLAVLAIVLYEPRAIMRTELGMLQG